MFLLLLFWSCLILLKQLWLKYNFEARINKESSVFYFFYFFFWKMNENLLETVQLLLDNLDKVGFYYLYNYEWEC